MCGVVIMLFNVSQLLKSSSGEERRYTFQEEGRRFQDQAADIRGSARLMRSLQGILVMAEIETGIACSCSRCLGKFVLPVSFHMEEEFLPEIDVDTGVRLSPPPEPSYTIDPHHMLDLSDALGQYAIAAAPMKPLCAADCKGLCPTCGQNMNQDPCDCAATQVDSRWAKLEGLGLQLRNG